MQVHTSFEAYYVSAISARLPFIQVPYGGRGRRQLNAEIRDQYLGAYQVTAEDKVNLRLGLCFQYHGVLLWSSNV